MEKHLTNEKEICQHYKDEIFRAISESKSNTDRALGGVLRSIKGTLVADITEAIVKIAWKEKGGSPYLLKFDQSREILCVEEAYIKRQKDPAVRDYLSRNRKEGFGFSVDKHVFIDGELVLGIECKAYAENAMLKRILVDFNLLTQSHPDMNCALVQLESMLGGDYANGKEAQLGSVKSHALMSQFDYDLNIITLLEGERKVNEPVHDPKHLKTLEPKLVRIAIERIKGLLPNPRR
jgi:hypothetical protein